jgi:hypothetical protein
VKDISLMKMAEFELDQIKSNPEVKKVAVLWKIVKNMSEQGETLKVSILPKMKIRDFKRLLLSLL